MLCSSAIDFSSVVMRIVKQQHYLQLCPLTIKAYLLYRFILLCIKPVDGSKLLNKWHHENIPI